MDREEIKTYLQYTIVLLDMNGIKDEQVRQALNQAIDDYEDNNEKHWLD